MYEVPQIVCYKSGAFSYQIAKRIIKVPYISLVNLIYKNELVKELIQSDLNRNKLIKELGLILADRGEGIRASYKEIKRELGEGTASKKAAELVYSYLVNKR